MDRVQELLAEATARGIRPWISLKERLSACAIRVFARSGGAAVLQGGAALHFAYGSPRLSADVDFVGRDVARVLEERGEQLARAAAELFERPARWSRVQSGRLIRGKVTVDLAPARRLALPVEAYPVPAHHPVQHGELGTVEDPAELAADKVVASLARLGRRGTLKTTDLYDLWYLHRRLGVTQLDRELIAIKLGEYGLDRGGLDPAVAARALPVEDLEAALVGVLPAEQRAGIDARAVLEAAAVLLEQYADGI